MANLAEEFAIDGILAFASILGELQFRGERTATHTSDVGFLDAEYAVDFYGTDAGTGAGTAGTARLAISRPAAISSPGV